MTADGTKIYIYNALNQLTQVKRASDNAVIATYAYNHNGLRKSKTVSGVTTTYNWDASGNLVRETTSGSSTYFYYVGSKLVGLKKNGTTYIVHDNLRGDVESITDTTGNIVAQAHYDPWGNRISASGSLVQPLRYAGYYYDDETGLYYLKSRYYSPVLGRFLTRDAIGYINYSDPQTLNLYSYCLNDPVSFTDPNGNWMQGDENIDFTDDDYDAIDQLGKDWWAATTQSERDAIHERANEIRGHYSDNDTMVIAYSEHKTNKTKSNRPKHQKGEARRQQDHGSEKGDARRRGNPNKRKNIVVESVVGVGIGYLVYRGIRMLPSLTPPLWWTIPGNLAVP